MPWPDYIKLDEDEVTFTGNCWDGQATIVLGPSDEQLLCKRFAKNVGPRARKLHDPEGTYLKSVADRHYQEVLKKRQEQDAVSADAATEDLAETLEGNSKKRKKEHALQALAKRAPKRKAKSCGSIIVA